jgi:hypothetical protein
VQVDEGADVGRRSFHARFHRLEFVAHLGHRRVEAGDLFLHQARRDDQVRHLKRGLRDEVRLADRNAARDGKTVQSEAH